MFFPYNTDAPIYHWPLATVGLIAVNTLVFIGLMQATDVEAIRPWILEYGTGLHPQQWVSANFIHGSIWHLVGNMFGLWGFGLIVEGKIGWWKFLVVYMGMAVGQCMMEQALIPSTVALGSYGASGVIFGLLAMALLWAPMNDVSCVVLIWIRPFFFDLNITVFAVLTAAIQLITASIAGMTFGSEALHLIGTMFGLVVGTVMLKLGWVDCENWDAFSVVAGRHRMSAEQLAELRERYPVDPEQTERRRRSALEQIKQILVDGRHELAYAAHRKMAGTLDDWYLPEPHFRKMIAGYHRAGQYAESIPLMVEYLRNYTERAPLVRLKLAEILIRHQRRPAQARRVLAKIPDGALDASQAACRRQLERLADRFRAEDVLELEAEDW